LTATGVHTVSGRTEVAAIFLGARRSLKLPGPSSSSDGPGRACVVHLVRAANGLEPFAAFLDSWRRYPPGADCDLVLALKGFAGSREAEPYLVHARAFHPEVLFFPDEGLDLGTYFAAATRLRRDRYCFLNSYSELLVEGWLAKLEAALGQPQVGIAGATGSWASTRSWVAYLLGMPSAYAGLLPERHVARQAFLAIDLERTGQKARSGWESLQAKLRTLPQMFEQILTFEPFPAYHVRTNAFMISHATLARLRLHAIRRKMDAYMLENGRASITRQLQRLGLRTLVVDRAGVLYDHDEWDRSYTLWQGDQEGLLVADNQTRSYARGDDDRRRLLSAFAWGARADPRSPR
jgi:hypothetical protein